MKQLECGRRYFLRAGALGSLVGVSLPEFLRLQSVMAAGKSKAQSCILMWLKGGPSHVDTWDPKPNSSFKPISTNVAGIQISSLLPRVAKHMDKLALVRSMHTLEQDHSAATYYAMTGHRPIPAMHFPSLGSIVTKELGPRSGLPAYVLEPQWERERVYEDSFKAGFLGPEFNPMITPDPSQPGFQVPDLSLPESLPMERLQDRRALLQLVDRSFRQIEESAEYANMDRFSEQALKMILSPEVRKAFDLSQEPQKVKESYGLHGLGQSVLLARRLVENGCRFVTAAGNQVNDWDTHVLNDKKHGETLVPQLDQSFAYLLEDLEQRGLLESTLVIAMGEFGRTPHHNANGGRDHWPQCWSLALGGGGIRGGQVIGASDERGAKVSGPVTSIGDLAATIYKAFGIDWKKEYMSPIGRPVKIANAFNDVTGEPIEGLV
ncbi:MAG: DUF1501 domain-containing protein [Acidobacteria bacterium]|nr:DUF1501 domain-containing protein [Acidobacteriota bacterium]